ncbi:hypothetical protein IP84_17365 [beta proteobacterium AAP99]|nr:hypothetical protein IP84_17365 [beta proteobacterium AAP99]
MTEVARVEKQVDAYAALHAKRREVLRKDLEVIDRAIRLHDIPIDPTVIPAIRTQTSGRLFNHRGLTRSILVALRSQHPEPVKTTDVALVLAARLGIDPLSNEFADLRLRTRMRLKDMCSNGVVRRLHASRTGYEGSWRLAEDAIL